MYMKKDEYIDETIYSLYQANADEIVREQCLAREDAERRERTYKRDYNRAMEENAALKAEKAALEADKSALEADKKALKTDYDSLKADFEMLKAQMAELQKKLENK